MSRSDKWNERDVVMRYRAFCDELRYKANVNKYQLGKTLDILFYLPMPESWSIKKKLAKTGMPHDQKPDIDNLVKGFIDAFKVEDKTVHDIRARKYWGTEGRIEVL
ncbi:MAG: RusA family crossover junction endodeoxyribonuclease [Thaumarchaeota archaeon]|nr:RusA family crossover junction endodeoxyribonuclease [Nitrososphaerota archaeon]